MLNSLRRIITIFKKDFKESIVVIILIMTMPVIGYLLPGAFQNNSVKVCIVNSDNSKPILGFDKTNITYESSKTKALELLKNKKVSAVVDINEKEVYTYSTDPLVLSKIKNGVSNETGQNINVNIINGELSDKTYNAFLCTILIVMIGIAGNPVVFINENKNDTLSALLLSPLSYGELILSKFLVNFISVLLGLFAFLFIIRQNISSFFAVLLFAIIIALFMTVMSAIITLPFKTLEQMAILTTPLSLIIVLIETILYEMGKVKYLPIQSGFRDIFLFNKFPIQQILFLVLITTALFFVYLFLFRRIKRLGNNY